MRCRRLLATGGVRGARERLTPNDAGNLQCFGARATNLSGFPDYRPPKTWRGEWLRSIARLCAHAVPNTVMARIRGQQTFAVSNRFLRESVAIFLAIPETRALRHPATTDCLEQR